jgi:hypothetical protein
LLDTAQAYSFDFLDSASILPDVNGIIAVYIISQIIVNATKSKSEKWDCSRLNNTKCTEIKSKWYTHLMKEMVNVEHQVLFMSNPVFNNDSSYAMIRMGRICGRSCGDSCVYFFKKVNGKWKKIIKTGCVII